MTKYSNKITTFNRDKEVVIQLAENRIKHLNETINKRQLEIDKIKRTIKKTYNVEIS